METRLISTLNKLLSYIDLQDIFNQGGQMVKKEVFEYRVRNNGHIMVNKLYDRMGALEYELINNIRKNDPEFKNIVHEEMNIIDKLLFDIRSVNPNL
jgi:hypothetical protein